MKNNASPSRLYLRLGRHQRRQYDPYRRLLAAIALEAVANLTAAKSCPPLTSWERQTARMFIANNTLLYQRLGIPQTKINALLAGVPPIFPQEVAS